jgi:Arc/MetJ-type ribon-helix-helix transcriptional regulator
VWQSCGGLSWKLAGMVDLIPAFVPAVAHQGATTKRQAELINNEVEAGRYTSASEFIRERIREWEQRRIDQDVAALEHAHTEAWERDTTPEEESSILKAQQEARAVVRARQGKQRG